MELIILSTLAAAVILAAEFGELFGGGLVRGTAEPQHGARTATVTDLGVRAAASVHGAEDSLDRAA
ncbi:MAG: hypothetical protein JSR73_07045 [Proteobacteria bacterium]|nr:hypothetical protein [Pseudomonadota bacterium]